jgi:hypothetical protein
VNKHSREFHVRHIWLCNALFYVGYCTLVLHVMPCFMLDTVHWYVSFSTLVLHVMSCFMLDTIHWYVSFSILVQQFYVGYCTLVRVI